MLHSSIYKLSYLITRCFWPLLSNKTEMSFDYALRDIFAHMCTCVNRYKKFRLNIIYERLDLIISKLNQSKPVIFCTTHTGGVPFALMQILDDLNYKTFVVAKGNLRSGWNWGTSKTPTVFRSDNNLLVKIRSFLKDNSALVIMVDYNYLSISKSGFVSPNIFIFASEQNYDIIFFTSVIQKDGSIKIIFGEKSEESRDGYDIARDFTRWLNTLTSWTYQVKKRQRKKGTHKL